MKTFLVFSIFLIKNISVNSQQLPTKLELTVVDIENNLISGALVSIYENETDYFNKNNSIFNGKTNMMGIVNFSNVRSIIYYVRVIDNERNNNFHGVKTKQLKEGRINKVNTVIE